MREIKPLKLTVIEILGPQSPNHNSSIANNSHQKDYDVFIFLHISSCWNLKCADCRLHPIALHGFDFLKTHTLLFHFARGCCNGSNSHRGERSCWTCSGRCAILSKNDWSDFVQYLWSGFKGNYGNSWFCDILCLFCSATFHQKNNKNFQPYCGDSSQPSSTFTPRKQKQTNPTSECIFSFPFLLKAITAHGCITI